MPSSLASTILEGSLHQHFLKDHFTSITDCKKNVSPTDFFINLYYKYLKNIVMSQPIMTPWQRLFGLLQLEKRDIRQIFYYAIFSGIVALSLPLGIQAIINLIQGAQISTSWVVLVVLVTIGCCFYWCITTYAITHY